MTMWRIGNWLRNLAVQLGEALNLSSPTNANLSEDDLQAYEQLLMEILQATSDSEGDERVVYPLLAENIAYLDLNLAEVLQAWATRTLAERQPNQARNIAVYIVNFSNLIREFPWGNKASNIEIAIAGYEVVLTVFTREAFPQDWAMTQCNLGIAYYDRLIGDKADNLEMAIASYKAALEVRTRKAFPQDWAMTQNNLGTAYLYRLIGDKAENLEMAIASYTAALEVRTREAFPQDWAMTQNNLGIAYRNRLIGDKAENLERAITAYNEALKVYTREAFPQDHAETLFNLGLAYQDAQQFTDAYTTFHRAIETVEFLRGEIVSGVESKRKQAETSNQLYRRMVEVCLELNQSAEAIEYIERSKTRNLVELLFNPDSNPQAAQSPNLKDQLEQLQKAIEGEKRRVESATLPYLNKLRQQREQLATRIIGLNPIRYSEIYHRLDPETAIIEFYIFENCFRAFIITRHNEQPHIWQSQPEDLDKLKDWGKNYLQLYFEDKRRWQSDLHNQLNELADILHIQDILNPIPLQCQKLILIPHRYLHLFPLHALPLSNQDYPSNQINLTPLPNEATEEKNSPFLVGEGLGERLTQQYLIDKFPKGVSYAPSCQLWRLVQDKAKQLNGLHESVEPHPNPPLGKGREINSPLNKGGEGGKILAKGSEGGKILDNQGKGSKIPQFRYLFAIQNPTDNLEFTDMEVETIAKAFDPRYILKKNQATAAALAEPLTAARLSNANWLHFSCHGYFNFNVAEKSALQLANSVVSPVPEAAGTSQYLPISEDSALDLDQCLTLEEIFQLNLPNCRLVTLSACETGLVDFRNMSDEYIGLPSGFIRAGAASIISTLWSVDDFSTALLMIKFYENLPVFNFNVVLALNQTQQWFRKATQRELLQWLDGKTEIEATQNQKIKKRLEQNYKPEHQPFKKPVYWAAFCAIGE